MAYPSRRWSLGCLLGLAAAAACAHAPRGAAAAPYRHDGPDSLMAYRLMTQGVAYRAGRAVVWVPRDSFTSTFAQALADSLARAIPAIEAFAGLPARWTRLAHPRVEYFVVPATFLAHSDAGARVFLPLQRVREGQVPYLHETTHALAVPRRTMPFEAADSAAFARIQGGAAFWLGEGLADYVGKAVAERAGLRDADPFRTGGTARVDQACAAHLAQPAGAAVAAYIGRNGAPPGLFTDRLRVALPFYVCSHSFVKFLSARFGAPRVAALLEAPDAEAGIAALGGGSAEALRDAWLAAVRASAGGAGR